MKVYIAVCKDRHINPVVAAFTTEPLAEKFAREFMDDHMAQPSKIEERHVEGCLLYLVYGDEGDYAFVVESELDQPGKG
jgi:hypothetical protein